MRYKACMRPSKLLCPESYAWIDIEPCLLKLDKQKYSRFNDDIDAIDEDGVVDIRKVRNEINFCTTIGHIKLIYRLYLKVLILYHQVAMPYEIYKKRSSQPVTQEEEDETKEYASLVGMKCAQRLLLYRG